MQGKYFSKVFILKEKKEDNTVQHDKYLDDLLSLLDEQDPLDLIDTLDLDALLQEHATVEGPLPQPVILKNKSDKFPPLNTNHNLATFVASVTAEIKKIKIHRVSGNLNQPERLALENLKKCYPLTIKPSDKGGNIVIMSNGQYRMMCNKILSNQDWHKPI